MSYSFFQQYWWFLVSLLGALLVFLMFVQGANSLIFNLGQTDTERRMLINSTGRKWAVLSLLRFLFFTVRVLAEPIGCGWLFSSRLCCRP